MSALRVVLTVVCDFSVRVLCDFFNTKGLLGCCVCLIVVCHGENHKRGSKGSHKMGLT